jgi:hypothetical protein
MICVAGTKQTREKTMTTEAKKVLVYTIKHRWTGAELFSAECDSLSLCVANAVDSNANLRNANLRGANLRDADLGGADLGGAYLRGANGVATRDECIARLDAIREHICVHGDQLKMDNWHGSGWNAELGPQHACETSHCLAGWAQALCADEGIRKLDPVTAGVRLIPLAAGRFWDGDEQTKEWLEKREYAK